LNDCKPQKYLAGEHGPVFIGYAPEFKPRLRDRLIGVVLDACLIGGSAWVLVEILERL
jgi:hypothetical protein